MKAEDLKLIVKEKYGEIASKSNLLKENSCCGVSGCCGDFEFSMIGEEYNNIAGHNPDADLALGCGLPTQYAGIKIGDSVLDLGSGAGNDCFVARAIVGETGHVTGIDFTDEMLKKAFQNLKKSGIKNMDFVKGDIENMPLNDNTFDVVISNCVLNLVPDKQRAFSEIYRVLKSGGHFCISDVVALGNLPQKLREAAEMYAGCVSGAILKEEYLALIKEQGFADVEVKAEREIKIPEDVLSKYISSETINEIQQNKVGIFSVTLNGTKNG